MDSVRLGQYAEGRRPVWCLCDKATGVGQRLGDRPANQQLVFHHEHAQMRVAARIPINTSHFQTSSASNPCRQAASPPGRSCRGLRRRQFQPIHEPLGIRDHGELQATPMPTARGRKTLRREWFDPGYSRPQWWKSRGPMKDFAPLMAFGGVCRRSAASPVNSGSSNLEIPPAHRRVRCRCHGRRRYARRPRVRSMLPCPRRFPEGQSDRESQTRRAGLPASDVRAAAGGARLRGRAGVRNFRATSGIFRSRLVRDR